MPSDNKLVIEILANNENLSKELKNSEDKLRKFEKSVEAMDGLDIGNSFLSANSTKRVKQELARITAVMDKELKTQLSLVQNNERAKGEIIKRFAKQRQDVEEQANTKMRELNTTLGDSGGVRSQLQQIMSQAGLGGMGDLLGGIGAKVGLIGAAFAGVVNGVRSLINYLQESVELVNKMESASTFTQSLFLSTEGQYKSAETASNLETQARSTARRGVDVSQVQSAQYLAISSAVATGENAGVIMDKVTQASIALNASIESTTMAVGGLTNALGENLSTDAKALEENLNLLNAVMDYGTIPSSEVLANNISRAAPAFLQASESSDEAKQALGAMMATITNAGVATEQANTYMMSFLTEMTDPAKLTKLKQLGIEGFDPLTRKITDYGALLSSMSENRMAVSDIFTSQEAIRGLNVLTANASSGFQTMMTNMEATNIEGLYQRKYELMSGTQEMELARQEARWQDLKIRVGKSLSGIVDVWNGMVNGIVSLFETAETKVYYGLEEMQQHLSMADVINDQRDAINSLTEGLNTDNLTQSFENVRGKLSEIRDVSPFIASQIEAILNNPQKQTVEGLEQIETHLKSMADVAMYEMRNQLKEAMDSMIEVSEAGSDLPSLLAESLGATFTADEGGQTFASSYLDSILRGVISSDKIEEINQGLVHALTMSGGGEFGGGAVVGENVEQYLQGIIEQVQQLEGLDPSVVNNAISQIGQGILDVKGITQTEAINIKQLIAGIFSSKEIDAQIGNTKQTFESFTNYVKELYEGLEPESFSRIMQEAESYAREAGLLTELQLEAQGLINSALQDNVDLAGMTYQAALEQLNLTSDRVNFESFVNQQLEAQGISQANNADAYRAALQQRIAGEQAVLQTMLAELAAAQAIVRESVRGSQEYIEAKGAIATSNESLSEQNTVIANLQNMINNLPSAASVISGSGGRAATAASGNRQREQNDFQKYLDQIRESTQKSEESMLNIQVDSYTEQRRQSQNSHANLLKDLKTSLDARHLTQAQYNELVENAEHSHAVEMVAINTQMNQEVHKQALEVQEQTVELYRTLERERRQALLSEGNEVGSQQLTESFAVEDENIRYNEQLKTIREQYGEDETRWQELRQAADELHQGNLTAIVERGERDRQDIIKKYTDNIKDFVNTQNTAREDARLTAFERELKQTNDQYAEMLKNAQKYGVDMTGIYESYLLDIVKLYDDNLKKLNSTILQFGTGYLEQYQHPIMQQVNELSNEINNISASIENMNRAAGSSVNDLDQQVLTSLENMNRAKQELDQYNQRSLNASLNRSNSVRQASSELVELQRQLNEVQENITNFQAAPEVNLSQYSRIGSAYRNYIEQAVNPEQPDLSKLELAAPGFRTAEGGFTQAWTQEIKPALTAQINSLIQINELRAEQTRLTSEVASKEAELSNTTTESNVNTEEAINLQNALTQATNDYNDAIDVQARTQAMITQTETTGANIAALSNITQFFGNITIFTNAFKELDGALREFQSNADVTMETANRMRDLFQSFTETSKEINQLKAAFASAFNLGELINVDVTTQQINDKFREIYDTINSFSFAGQTQELTLQEILGLSEDAATFYQSMGIDTAQVATEQYLSEVKAILAEKQPEIQEQIAMLFSSGDVLESAFKETANNILQEMTNTLNEINNQIIQQKGGMDAITNSYAEQIRQVRLQSKLREDSLSNQEAAIRRQLQQENLLPGIADQLNNSLLNIASQRNVNNQLTEEQVALLEKQQKQDEMGYLVSQWQSVSSTIVAVNDGIIQMGKSLKSGDIGSFVDELSSTLNSLGSSIMAVAPQAGAAMMAIGTTISTVKSIIGAWTTSTEEYIQQQTDAIKELRTGISMLVETLEYANQTMLDLGLQVSGSLQTTAENNQLILDQMIAASIPETHGSAKDFTPENVLYYYQRNMEKATEYQLAGDTTNATYYQERAQVYKDILDQMVTTYASMYAVKEQLLDQAQAEIDLGHDVVDNLKEQSSVIVDVMQNNAELWNNEEYRNQLLEQGYNTLKEYASITGEILDYRIYYNLTEAEQLDIDMAIIEGKAEMAKLELEAQKTAENANEIELKQLLIERESLQDQYWKLKATGATEQEILEMKIKRRENEQAILDLKLKIVDAAAEEKKQELEFAKARGEYAEEMDQYYRDQMSIVQQQIRDTILLGKAGEDNLKGLQKEYADLKRQALDMNSSTLLAEIEHREAMGQYDDNEMDYLDDKLTILKDLLNQRIDEGIIGKENWEIEEAIVGLEQEKNDLISDRLGLEDEELNNLVKQHQQILRTARLSGKSLSRAEQASLSGLESEISGRMSELGVSSSDIAATMSSFGTQKKYYQSGGWVNEQEAIAEKGEYVIPAKSAASIDKRFPGLLDNMRNIKNMTFPDYSQELHPVLAESMLNIMSNQGELERLKSESNSFSIDARGDITVNTGETDAKKLLGLINAQKTANLEKAFKDFLNKEGYNLGKTR